MLGFFLHLALIKKSTAFIQASLYLNEIQTMPCLSCTNLLILDIITYKAQNYNV